MSGYQFSFEKLRVWQHARDWVGRVYELSASFPKSEAFNLTSQMNRAAVSVVANLAEGSSRSTGKDQAHFSNLAYSSLMETACLVLLAGDRGHISAIQAEKQRAEIAEIANPINALRIAQLKKS